MSNSIPLGYFAASDVYAEAWPMCITGRADPGQSIIPGKRPRCWKCENDHKKCRFADGNMGLGGECKHCRIRSLPCSGPRLEDGRKKRKLNRAGGENTKHRNGQELHWITVSEERASMIASTILPPAVEAVSVGNGIAVGGRQSTTPAPGRPDFNNYGTAVSDFFSVVENSHGDPHHLRDCVAALVCIGELHFAVASATKVINAGSESHIWAHSMPNEDQLSQISYAIALAEKCSRNKLHMEARSIYQQLLSNIEAFRKLRPSAIGECHDSLWMLETILWKLAELYGITGSICAAEATSERLIPMLAPTNPRRVAAVERLAYYYSCAREAEESDVPVAYQHDNPLHRAVHRKQLDVVEFILQTDFHWKESRSACIRRSLHSPQGCLSSPCPDDYTILDRFERDIRHHGLYTKDLHDWARFLVESRDQLWCRYDYLKTPLDFTAKRPGATSVRSSLVGTSNHIVQRDDGENEQSLISTVRREEEECAEVEELGSSPLLLTTPFFMASLFEEVASGGE
ncbi:hypothetical protein BZA05DRAFT_477514 [Tricharina praecox]|uniref:uncharacterized protein n=1 Tax=Tricharina praecox TaxID=43433 RepID=UPI00221E7475|nr:uncharacterized protein BZA05DRAFT_477942 [Tricharina praecox]XP_051335139.1 uncharacterized protein BZA05DRAFT_477514 [Tricharina praecox]KAI5840901.1 hypothetical protein BZA05DRAFT_477942 [Tricharina praecox]KAI5842367.1 hypothetical protein BZA05DRAFT_477514 [Tricharina praecox]